MIKNGILLLLSVFFLSSLFSCAKNNDLSSEDVVLKSYRLIDEQRTDEAIVLLEEKLKDDPDNYDYKAVLASAYAHKSGFKIQKLIPLVSLFSKIAKENLVTKDKAAVASDDSNKSKKDQEIDIELLNDLSKIQTAIDIFNTVPTVSEENAVYLNHAIYLLNTLKSDIKSEDIVYRVLLKILKLKYKIVFQSKEDLTHDVRANRMCVVDMIKVDAFLSDFAQDIFSIVNDIKTVQPTQTESLNQFQEELSQTILKFKQVANSSKKLDDVTNALLKQGLLQGELGAFIKCL